MKFSWSRIFANRLKGKIGENIFAKCHAVVSVIRQCKILQKIFFTNAVQFAKFTSNILLLEYFALYTVFV